MINNFINITTVYFRCVKSVKNQNFWSLEQETINWLGAYKLCGKNNYYTEGLHRISMLYGSKLTNFDLEMLRVNRFFLMTEGGNAMSLDDVNEMVNAWKKSFLKSPNFKDNIERSKYTATLRKCAYQTFGYREGRTARLEANQEVHVSKIVALLDRCNIFGDVSVKREFDKEFFWNHVKIPKATGSKKDADRESMDLTIGKSRLFNVLCVTETEQETENFLKDEEDVDDDVDNASLMSSRAGSVVDRNDGYAADSDSDSGDERDASDVTNEAKKVSKVDKKKLSNLIHKDLLGVDGDDAMHDMKKLFERDNERDRKMIDMIHMSNRHFENKMKQRMIRCEANNHKSQVRSYRRGRYKWRNDYKTVLANKRNERVVNNK